MAVNKAFFLVELAVFDYDIIVSCGQSNKEIYKSLLEIPGGKKHLIKEFKYGIENPPSAADAYCIILDNGCTLLRLFDYPKKASDYGVLMHEVLHSIATPLRRRGLKLSNKSEEAYAYAIGYVSEKIFAQLWKQ